MQIDDMYALTRAEMERQLANGLPEEFPRFWLVVSDAAGVACSPIDPLDGGETTPMRDAFYGDPDIDGAATVSFVRPYGEPQLLADVIVRNPENSDLRRAALSVKDGVHIDVWEHTV